STGRRGSMLGRAIGCILYSRMENKSRPAVGQVPARQGPRGEHSPWDEHPPALSSRAALSCPDQRHSATPPSRQAASIGSRREVVILWLHHVTTSRPCHPSPCATSRTRCSSASARTRRPTGGA